MDVVATHSIFENSEDRVQKVCEVQRVQLVTLHQLLPQGGRPSHGRQNQILLNVKKDLQKNHFQNKKVFKTPL